MIKISVVGCTGKLGSIIAETILNQEDLKLSYAIGRTGNRFIGRDISEVIGGMSRDLVVTDSIEKATDCDVFIDCTNSETFISNNLSQYTILQKPILIATTGFDKNELEKIKDLSRQVPVFISGNYSIALYDFIETLKFAVKRISEDTHVQIIEFHHNQKKDAPSGTALMIKKALIDAKPRLSKEGIDICSIRGGSIFGEHRVIFANSKDEVMEYHHQVSSRAAFSDGAIQAARWLQKQKAGYYTMEDFCS